MLKLNHEVSLLPASINTGHDCLAADFKRSTSATQKNIKFVIQSKIDLKNPTSQTLDINLRDLNNINQLDWHIGSQ